MPQQAPRLWLFHALELQLWCKKGPAKLFNSPWEHLQPEMRWPKIFSKNPFVVACSSLTVGEMLCKISLKGRHLCHVQKLTLLGMGFVPLLET